MIENKEIADTLEKVADLLNLLEDENPFRIRAYRNAAWTVREQPKPMHEMIADGEDLTDLDFIGKDMAAAIKELATSGTLAMLDELALKVPLSLCSVLRIPGLGPVKARRVWRELGVVDLASLEEAIRSGRLSGLSGFGPKTAENLLRRVERLKDR